MSDKTIFPSFIPITNEWDNIEVHPVWDDGNGVCEPCDKDEDASFFSVYLHQVDGGIMCVADLATREQAEALAKLIEQAVGWYEDMAHTQLYRQVYAEMNRLYGKNPVDYDWTPFAAKNNKHLTVSQLVDFFAKQYDFKPKQ